MLILQGVPLCKAAKLQETTEMQRQTNPPGERRKFPYQNPQGNTTKPKGLMFPWVPCFLLAVWNWVKYLHGNWRGTHPPQMPAALFKSLRRLHWLEVRKGKVCINKSAPLEKGQSRQDDLFHACTSHDASNVPPFLSLIGDGRWQNDIEFGGLEWWASSIHFVWGLDCLVQICTLGINFRHAYGGWSVQLVHKPQKISSKKQEWPKHPKVSGAKSNQKWTLAGRRWSWWLILTIPYKHVTPPKCIAHFRLRSHFYPMLFSKILRTPNKLRILLGRFLHPFPAPSHFQPHGPRGPPSPPTVLGHALAPVPTTWQWYPSAKRGRDRLGALLRWIRHKDPRSLATVAGSYSPGVRMDGLEWVGLWVLWLWNTFGVPKEDSKYGWLHVMKCLLKSFCNTSLKIQIVPETW